MPTLLALSCWVVKMLEGLTPKSRLYPCKVRSILEDLNEADHKILVEALENPVWTTSNLAAALNERGLKISRFSLDSHKGKVCSCWRI